MAHKDEMNALKKSMESWEKGCLHKELKASGERKGEFATASGIPVKRLYTPLDLKERNWNYQESLGFPGEFPFTRGISPTMYRGNLWVMFQYGGFGTALATNEWFKYLLDQGATMLALAQDLPSQMGMDSDSPMARGEVGKIGVALDSLADVETVFDGIPIDKVSISTTSNATGPIFLALMLALAERRGISPQSMSLTIQNDVLKEIISRHTHIFPPRPSLRFSCDVTEYCGKNGLGNILSPWFCGYHMREAGGNVFHELGFLLANIVEFLDELVKRGIDLDGFYRPVASFTAGMDFFEEICKHRAYRRMFARMMKERYHVKNPRTMSAIMYDHSQASAFTAEQPMNNIVRGTVNALVQALAGVQVMSVACFDEAHAIPSPEAARIGLRTQQIIAHETGVTNTVDPLAGSYFVETLTDELEEKATGIFDEVQALGGAVVGIQQGFQERAIAEEAYRHSRQVKSREKVVVGVNEFQVDEKVPFDIMKVDPKEEGRQIEKVRRLKKERDSERVKMALKEIQDAAEEKVNLVLPILGAVKEYATIGEICDVLRNVYGEYEQSLV